MAALDGINGTNNNTLQAEGTRNRYTGRYMRQAPTLIQACTDLAANPCRCCRLYYMVMDISIIIATLTTRTATARPASSDAIRHRPAPATGYRLQTGKGATVIGLYPRQLSCFYDLCARIKGKDRCSEEARAYFADARRRNRQDCRSGGCVFRAILPGIGMPADSIAPDRPVYFDTVKQEDNMNWITETPLILALSATVFAAPATAVDAGSLWQAYVCRVTDWPDCEQNRNNKRVYPDERLYPDKNTCLDSFGQLFENDPAISGKYPQTNDASNSYVFDCEAAR